MHVVAAPDKFKGTATAAEICEAIANAAAESGHSCTQVPLADGGDGTLEALGGANRTSTVTGPLGDSVDAEWRLDAGVAVIGMARTSGLVLAGGSEGNDPLAASTVGVGELISEAIDNGAKKVIVGVGGSATTDGGLGAIDAIQSTSLRSSCCLTPCRFFNEHGYPDCRRHEWFNRVDKPSCQHDVSIKNGLNHLSARLPAHKADIMRPGRRDGSSGANCCGFWRHAAEQYQVGGSTRRRASTTDGRPCRYRIKVHQVSYSCRRSEA